MKAGEKRRDSLLPRFRVMCGKETALGPGKAELLERIVETGSIGEAAKQMGMSYMRAWKLVKTMNRCFKQPLVAPRRGGKTGGGAALTATGKQVLELYHAMEALSEKATWATWTKLKTLLKR